MPARISKVLGVERRAALDNVRAELLVEAAHAGTRRDRHDAAAHVELAAPAAPSVVASSRALRWSSCSCMSATSSRSTVPLRRKTATASSRIVRVNVNSQVRRVADDEQRIAELLELGTKRRRSMAVARHDEVGAVAVAARLVLPGMRVAAAECARTSGTSACCPRRPATSPATSSVTP